MILRGKPGKLELLFAVRGSIVPIILPRVLFLMAVAALMVFLDKETGVLPRINEFGFTIFGIALSLFLGFRNNAAYDRWWESRKLWGGLLADMRALARDAEIFITDAERRRAMLRLALAFLHLHRRNLRGLTQDERSSEVGGAFLEAPHPPCAALDEMARLVADGRTSGAIDGFGAKALGERLGAITLAQAGCERIAGTPLPYVYSLLIYRTAYLYCLLLPLSLVGPAGWFTPVVVGIVGYVFLGLAEVSEELAHPFGTTPNALPLDAICRAAEISLAPHLGEDAPLPLKAQNYYLS